MLAVRSASAPLRNERREPDAIRLELVVGLLGRDERRAVHVWHAFLVARYRGAPRAQAARSATPAPTHPSLPWQRSAANQKPDDYEAPFLGGPSGSISAELVACGISGWPHFQQ